MYVLRVKLIYDFNSQASTAPVLKSKDNSGGDSKEQKSHKPAVKSPSKAPAAKKSKKSPVKSTTKQASIMNFFKKK